MQLDSTLVALLVSFGVFAIGDILGVATKAKVSSVFVALLLFLVGFLTGVIPANIIDNSTLAVVATWASGYIVFHMGTMINIRQLAAEWRTVVLTVLSMLVAGLSTIILIPILGNNIAMGSIPVLNGGLVATNIIAEKANSVGAPEVAAFVAILYAIQKFVGTPIASYFGLKEANLALVEFRANGVKKKVVKNDKQVTEVKKELFYEKYSKYYTDFVCLAVSALFVCVAYYVAKFVNDTALSGTTVKLHYTIVALILGAVVGYIGLVPPKVLEKGKTSGLLSVAVFASIIPSLAKITLNDMVKFSGFLIIIFAALLIVTYIVFYILPTWKLIGSKNVAMGIAMGQLLGFPATYLISQEIAKAVTDDSDEQEYIMELIGSRYIVAGFASVTTFSIITAGIFANFIN